MTETVDAELYWGLVEALREQGVGVPVKTPYSKSVPKQEVVSRLSDEGALRSNLESLIALYLSERFMDFDQWMLAQAPMLEKTKIHHEWLLTKAYTMRRLADQCKAMDPAKTATAILQNLMRATF